jgi:hypothetical protein
VPRISIYPQREEKATEILDWLISLDIVKPTLSDCILSSKYGYSISDGAKSIVEDFDNLPLSLSTNGLEIILERQIFDTGQNGLEELICPNCKRNISDEEWSFFNEWYEAKSNNLTCPLCKESEEIHNFEFSPEWGFSDFGFRFWNWPELDQYFLSQFQEKLNCEISIVYQHV